MFGNCADDARRFIAAAAGFDAADPFSAELDPRSLPINGPVIGVLEPVDEYFLGDQQARTAYERGIDRLRTLGYQTTVIDYRPLREVSDMTYFGPSMSERTAVLGEFIEAHPQATYSAVVRDAIVKAAKFSAVDAFRMLHRLKELERQIDLDIWSHVDLLCTPTAPTIYTRDQVRKDPAYASTSLGCYTNFAPFLGLPAVSVPNGFRQDGMPTGMMFVGQRASDLAVLQVAEIFSS